jgi:hypothetical protein
MSLEVAMMPLYVVRSSYDDHLDVRYNIEQTYFRAVKNYFVMGFDIFLFFLCCLFLYFKLCILVVGVSILSLFFFSFYNFSIRFRNCYDTTLCR